ncbi:MAG: precorrin-2 C(20)-methyltransferase [Clostridiales bacterium]|nr:precorrin-2 C(20)-methyltransferase [Eubacteriales bacterium]MDH7565727.1 precorrin-2 C(20)-methyltransferase [Clostridiales bacterium]
MPGKLYGIGVGPGDPELVTLKAKRILEGIDYIAIPKTSPGKGSKALSIVEGLLGGKKEIIELVFPMSFDEKVLEEGWGEAVAGVREKLDAGKNVAFITLGDPTVYSTYIYIHKTLKAEGYDIEIIPGVTSFCASAARVGISLGENKEGIAVIPSAYDCENLDSILDSFDNIVLMKVASSLPRLKDILKEKGLMDKAVLVSKCGFEDEVIEFDMEEASKSRHSYFSTMIIKKNGVR